MKRSSQSSIASNDNSSSVIFSDRGFDLRTTPSDSALNELSVAAPPSLAARRRSVTLLLPLDQNGNSLDSSLTVRPRDQRRRVDSNLEIAAAKSDDLIDANKSWELQSPGPGSLSLSRGQTPKNSNREIERGSVKFNELQTLYLNVIFRLTVILNNLDIDILKTDIDELSSLLMKKENGAFSIEVPKKIKSLEPNIKDLRYLIEYFFEKQKNIFNKLGLIVKNVKTAKNFFQNKFERSLNDLEKAELTQRQYLLISQYLSGPNIEPSILDPLYWEDLVARSQLLVEEFDRICTAHNIQLCDFSDMESDDGDSAARAEPRYPRRPAAAGQDLAQPLLRSFQRFTSTPMDNPEDNFNMSANSHNIPSAFAPMPAGALVGQSVFDLSPVNDNDPLSKSGCFETDDDFLSKSCTLDPSRF